MTFREKGPLLFGLGYPVLPAQGKAVQIKGWSEMPIDLARVEHWATNGQAGANLSVRTGDPSVAGIALTLCDIDILDIDVARRVAAAAEEHFGATIERRGKAPKRGLVFAMAGLWGKVQAEWQAPDGVRHKVEWLAKGQQFVALGIHPDTRKPYTYRDRSIDEVEPWELPVVEECDVLTWMRDVLPGLLPADWVPVGASVGGVGVTGEGGSDVLANYAPRLDIDQSMIDRCLSVLDPDMDHDHWVLVGMALHHQLGDTGLEVWRAWSAKGTKFDAGVFEAKWRSFAADASRRRVTFASVIKMAKESDGWAEAVKAEKVEALTGWLEKVTECADVHDLQALAETEIAFDKGLADVDRMQIIAALQARAQELVGVRPTKDIVTKWVKRRGNRPLPDLNGDGRPLETEENIKTICDNHGLVIRYNVIKKDDEILIPGASFTIDNRRAASLTHLRSLCHRAEVPTKHLKPFVTLLADKNQFNPVVEWVMSRPWDGVSRLQSYYDTVAVRAGECETSMKELVMRRWAVSAIAAAFSPNGITARGVMVFQGRQYSGKTRWIDSMVPKDLELVKTGKSLNVHDKDSVKQILSCWIAELGELDATFKKSDIAALKAFISNDTDELRRPYAEAESQYARRTVFYASVNEEEFLQDDTGNTRFWVIPIERVDFNHTIDIQQLWAEVLALWKSGEPHWLSDQEMAMLSSHTESFSAPNPIGDMIGSHLDWEGFNMDNCQWMAVSDVLRWIGHKNPTKWDATAAGKEIMKLNGGHRKKTHGKRLTAVPLRRKMIFGESGWSGDSEIENGVSEMSSVSPDEIPF